MGVINHGKKYKCEVSLIAEDRMTGVVNLTKKEYETIKRISDPWTWEDRIG